MCYVFSCQLGGGSLAQFSFPAQRGGGGSGSGSQPSAGPFHAASAAAPVASSVAMDDEEDLYS